MVIVLIIFMIGGLALATEQADELYFDLEAYNPEEVEALIQSYAMAPLIWSKMKPIDIQQLPFRNDLKMRLIEAREKYPDISSWAEVMSLNLFSTEEIEILSYFIAFQAPRHPKSAFSNLIQSSYRSARFDLGKIYSKWRQTIPRKYVLGGLVERDIGEKSLCDHWNISGSYTDEVYDYSILVGAFRLQWGYGLLYANNLMSSWSNEAKANVSCRIPTLTNYWGVDENRYLFGIGVQKNVREGRIMAWGSINRVDATLEQGVIRNFRFDGIHVSSSQLKWKNCVKENQFGLSGYLSKGPINCGILFSSVDYSKPLEILRMRKRVFNGSLYNKVSWAEWELASEIVFQNCKGWGTLQSLIYNGDNWDWVISGRYYSPWLFSTLGASLVRNTPYPRNEKGLYMGWDIKLSKKLFWSMYIDFYRTVNPPKVATTNDKGAYWVNWITFKPAPKTIFTATYKLKTSYKAYEQRGVTRKNYLQLRCQRPVGNSTLNFTWLSSSDNFWGFQNSAFSIYLKKYLGVHSIFIGSTEYYLQSGEMLNIYEPGVPLQYNFSNLTGRGYQYFSVVNLKLPASSLISCSFKYKVKNFQGRVNAEWEAYLQLEIGL